MGNSMTHTRGLDGICDLDKVFRVLGSVLAPNEHFDGESTPLDLIQVLGWDNVSKVARRQQDRAGFWRVPFFCVVRM